MKRIVSFLFLGAILLFNSALSAKDGNLIFRLFDAKHQLLKEVSAPVNSGKAEINLNIVREFQEGDYIRISGSKLLFLDFGDSIAGSYIYAPDKDFIFEIPLNECGRTFSKSTFSGNTHSILIRSCSKSEWKVSRNIALNPFDIRGKTQYYPHATSNSEYGNQSVFAARNVIDGFKSNQNHGKWPYQSWGPYKSDSIWLKIDFGKEVEVEKIVIINRAQFADNHDSAWQFATLLFSDGTSEKITLNKTYLPQEIRIKKHKTSFVKFNQFKAFEDNWCSWTEIEVWGKY